MLIYLATEFDFPNESLLLNWTSPPHCLQYYPWGQDIFKESEREEVIIQGRIISDNSPTGGSYSRGHLINGFEAIIWENRVTN